MENRSEEVVISQIGQLMAIFKIKNKNDISLILYPAVVNNSSEICRINNSEVYMNMTFPVP